MQICLLVALVGAVKADEAFPLPAYPWPSSSLHGRPPVSEQTPGGYGAAAGSYNAPNLVHLTFTSYGERVVVAPAEAISNFNKRSAEADPTVLAGASRIISAPTPFIHNPPVRPVIAAPALGYSRLPIAYTGVPALATPLAGASDQSGHRLYRREAEDYDEDYEDYDYYGTGGYGVGSYGYGGYTGGYGNSYGFGGFGNLFGSYGKRSADSDPAVLAGASRATNNFARVPEEVVIRAEFGPGPELARTGRSFTDMDPFPFPFPAPPASSPSPSSG